MILNFMLNNFMLFNIANILIKIIYPIKDVFLSIKYIFLININVFTYKINIGNKKTALK